MDNRLKYLSENLMDAFHAGSKARQDIESILNGRYLPLSVMIKQRGRQPILQKIIELFSVNNFENAFRLWNESRDKVVVMQYPFDANRLIYFVLCNMLRYRTGILFVHDIDSLRDMGRFTLRDELAVMNSARVVVLHNDRMIEKLRGLGLCTKVVNLQLFDYLLPEEPPHTNFQLGRDIIFAGNLGKSTFLTQIPSKLMNIHFVLYGIGLPATVQNNINVTYRGSFSPEEIPYKLKGNFGLIWDGTSFFSCDGSVGKYMQYNNPHKLSLYIAAGLPVVVWEKAAIADFVEKYNIGFTVSSLYDLEKRIESVSEPMYMEYRENIKKLQAKVCKGFFTKRALDMIENILDEGKK